MALGPTQPAALTTWASTTLLPRTVQGPLKAGEGHGPFSHSHDPRASSMDGKDQRGRTVSLSHPCHHPEDKSSLSHPRGGLPTTSTIVSSTLLLRQGEGPANPRAATGERRGQISCSCDPEPALLPQVARGEAGRGYPFLIRATARETHGRASSPMQVCYGRLTHNSRNVQRAFLKLLRD